MEVFEAISTTRAMRRLDPDRPVSNEDLLKIVEAATKGPTGGNSQPGRWVVVTDTAKRRKLGEIYKACWDQARKFYEGNPDFQGSPILKSANYLGDHMGDAPAIIIPCARGQGAESSVFGCVQNLFLAARALGLGTTLTTVHRMREKEVKELLGIPDEVNTYAMVPVGYPKGNWGEAVRRPVREVAYWNDWKSAPPV